MDTGVCLCFKFVKNRGYTSLPNSSSEKTVYGDNVLEKLFNESIYTGETEN